MSIKSYLSIFFLLTFSLVKSQSFENVSLVNKKMDSYPFTINRSYNDTNGSATYQASAQSSIIALEMSG